MSATAQDPLALAKKDASHGILAAEPLPQVPQPPFSQSSGVPLQHC